MSIADLYRVISPPATDLKSPAAKIEQPKMPTSGPSEFEALLKSNVQLSQHAENRIRSREIPWDANLEKRIQSGIDKAQSKGSREALILAGDVAVIANVKSRTIVTAMDSTQLKDRVFTNIDSAVLV